MRLMSADFSQPQQLHQHIWAMIIAGCADPANDLHWPMLASTTVASEHVAAEPNVRTVVLRAASEEGRWLECHSAMQTGKIAELQAQPIAMMAFNDRPSRQQLRLKGEVSIHNNDAHAKQIWATLSARQHPEYGSIEQFAVLRLHVQSIDWLRLGKTRHDRIRLEYPAGNGLASGSPTGTEAAPIARHLSP